MAKTTPKLKEIYAQVEQIWAKKGENSLWPRQPFKHKFGRGVKMYGVKTSGSYSLKTGDILIRSKGKVLWKDFEYVNRKKDNIKKEPFLENPPSLVIVGGNPPKKLRRRKGASARKRKFKLGRSGSKHRPVAYTVGGRWQTSPKAHIAKRGSYVNPLGETLVTVGGNPMATKYYSYYARRKSNPARYGIRQLGQVQKWLPIAGWGMGSAIATGAAPGLIGAATPWMKLGAQLGSAVLGAMLIQNMPVRGKTEAAASWFTVGVSLATYDFARPWLARWFPQIPLGAAPVYHGYEEAMAEDSQQVGQYPDEMNAYPEEVSAYPEEVSAYPYNGGYPY